MCVFLWLMVCGCGGLFQFECKSLIRTQETYVGQKANKIAKFSILGQKNKICNLDGKWPTDHQKCQNVEEFDLFAE